MASVVIRIMAEVVHRLHVAAALQQHLHRVLAAVLTAQNQRRPGAEGVKPDIQLSIFSLSVLPSVVLNLFPKRKTFPIIFAI